MGLEEGFSLAALGVTVDRVAVAAAVAGGAAALLTLALNRRDRTRAMAAEVFAIVTWFQTKRLSGEYGDNEKPGTVVVISNRSRAPIYASQLVLCEWGERQRWWRLRARHKVWTGARVEGRLYPVIAPESESEPAELAGVSGERPPGESPPVVLWFRDGNGRSWVRWPDGRLSRCRRR